MYIMIDQSGARVCSADRMVRFNDRIDGIINGLCEWLERLVWRI